MDERGSYSQVLGITVSWSVNELTTNLSVGEILIKLGLEPSGHECPHCGGVSSHHDTKVRR